MNSMTSDEPDESWQVVDTLEKAAVVVASFISMGRIRPVHEGDTETETVLAALSLEVRKQEKVWAANARMDAPHSPEPWGQNLVRVQRCIYASDGGPVAYVHGTGAHGASLGESDAKRIVACVNACAGIADPVEMRAQRDELLAALQALEALFAPLARDSTAATWIDKARAAITKAKGDA